MQLLGQRPEDGPQVVMQPRSTRTEPPCSAGGQNCQSVQLRQKASPQSANLALGAKIERSARANGGARCGVGQSTGSGSAPKLGKIGWSKEPAPARTLSVRIDTGSPKVEDFGTRLNTNKPKARPMADKAKRAK